MLTKNKNLQAIKGSLVILLRLDKSPLQQPSHVRIHATIAQFKRNITVVTIVGYLGLTKGRPFLIDRWQLWSLCLQIMSKIEPRTLAYVRGLPTQQNLKDSMNEGMSYMMEDMVQFVDLFSVLAFELHEVSMAEN